MMMDNPSPQWIAVARLLRPQGRRGELLADLLTDLPDLFTAGRRVAIAPPAHPPVSSINIETSIESSWRPTGKNAARIVLKLVNSNSITEAKLLAGRDLLIPAVDLPALAADTWFVRDLLGCILFDGDTPIGEITDVQYPVAADGRTRLPDAAPLLEVTPAPATASATAAQEPSLIPFIRAWLETVDLAHRRVLMHLPPGLVQEIS
ncbi:MAG TPA: 16S rRNA processing protein RimM [Acidobacteriaceae bacterium]|jgi:16S rRNA processing protein RimM|nr:16S rRNA processing protein RimM [Acidobacteriaceae bacterium]